MMRLCELGEIDEQHLFPLGEQDEASAQLTVVSLLVFFRSFLDQRPWVEVGFLSRRAENILRRERAKSIADVRQCLLKAQSNMGLPGAGRLVQSEWARLLLSI